MLVNLNHIKAVTPFASTKNTDDWLGYVHVKVTTDKRVYEALCGTHAARIVQVIGTNEEDTGEVWLDPRSFKLPNRINIPIAVLLPDTEHHTFTIPQVNVMGRLMTATAPDEDTIGQCFDRVYDDPVYGDMYVQLDPAIMLQVQKFIGAGSTSKDFLLPRPWLQLREGTPAIAAWTCRDANDESVYYGAVIATYRVKDKWPLFNMSTLVAHPDGPDHMPNYYEE